MLDDTPCDIRATPQHNSWKIPYLRHQDSPTRHASADGDSAHQGRYPNATRTATPLNRLTSKTAQTPQTFRGIFLNSPMAPSLSSI